MILKTINNSVLLSPLEQFEINSVLQLFAVGAIINKFLVCILFLFMLRYCIESFAKNQFYSTMCESVDSAVENYTEDFSDFITFLRDDIYVVYKEEFYSKMNISYPIWDKFFFYSFLSVTVSNILGLFPFSYTMTSLFCVIFLYTLSIFLLINFAGISIHGWNYFNLFLPSGVPYILGFLLVGIEFFSYFVRVFSLSIRLFANMLSGHMLIKVLIMLITSSITVTSGGIVISVVSIILVSLVMLLEFVIALVQAYVYFILIGIYFGDVIDSH